MKLVFKEPIYDLITLIELYESQKQLRYTEQNVTFIYEDSIYSLILNTVADHMGRFQCFNLKTHVPRKLHLTTHVTPVTVEIHIA